MDENDFIGHCTANVERPISNEKFSLFEAKMSLNKIINSMNSQTNESTVNNGLTPEHYKHFSNELAPVLLDVYNSWRNVGTMVVTSRTGIISVNICQLQKTLDTAIGENSWLLLKNRTILHTLIILLTSLLSTIRDVIDDKLKKNFDRFYLDFVFSVLRKFSYGVYSLD